MIRIEVDTGALGRIRLAVSPLWETVGSLTMLSRYPAEAPWPYTTWSNEARSLLADDVIGKVAELVAEFGGRGPPAILTPVPTAPATDLEHELAQLCDLPPDRVRADLHAHFGERLPPAAAELAADPAGILTVYAKGLSAYWTGAVAPHWPAIRAALDEEILVRGKVFATEGPRCLLGSLHARVDWTEPTLTLASANSRELTVGDGSVVVVPLLFARGAAIVSSAPDGSVAFGYPARGAAILAGMTTMDSADGDLGTDRLAVLVGRRRAHILRLLAVPTTTTTLANALGLAVSTISEHLAALVTAGAARRRRIGMRVLYELDTVGAGLLDAFGD